MGPVRTKSYSPDNVSFGPEIPNLINIRLVVSKMKRVGQTSPLIMRSCKERIKHRT
jgi:hypothetical protein